jgi:hypothetical protein
MGTDIHVIAQVKNELGVWEDVPLVGENIENRNYTWFTFLDGCRKDRVGIYIAPISKPRGAPEGFHVDSDHGDAFYKDKWMGYGISSWATLQEILDHEKTLPPMMYRVGPIDELEETFTGHDPKNCRIVFGYDS